MSKTEEFKALGRDDANSIESILADDAIDFGTLAHTTPVGSDAIFTWDYDRSRAGLSKLYERAKTSQWNGSTDLDWSIEVDVEAVAREMQSAIAHLRQRLVDLPNSPLKKWTEAEWTHLAIEAFNWRMSQFLHGEQGALICTAKIVETVPWIDAKYYASTQVMDEARHVEVFSRYLDTKLDGHYPVNPALQLLIDDIIGDNRWDMTYMGMQIMVEGLALAAFGFMHAVTQEPLLKKLLRYVMSDEARHVAFGVLSLKEYYAGLGAAEIKERQEFAFEAALRMRDRLMMHAVWERCGVDREMITRMLFEVRKPGVNPFQAALFSKIVPNCKKLGLLDAGDGWLRERFTDIGVIEYEDAPDTETEYALLDAVAADREATPV
ncbi:MAG: ferritin-like domain-containing protein [Acidimicrobiia bacterium]|nr:ferritin-like domain-containing protein [Acidimicrobiia bacterium]